MNVWFAVTNYSQRVRTVVVVRETAKTLVITDPASTRRRDWTVHKESTGEAYYPTFAEAKAWLVREAEAQVAAAKTRLNAATRQLEEANAVTDPTQTGV